FRAGPAPDLVIQLGAPPTSGALSAYLAGQAGLERWVATAHGWIDPDSFAGELVVGAPAAVAVGLVERLADRPRAPSPWQRRWQGAEELAQRAIDEFLVGDLSEGAAVRVVGGALEPGATLFAGNSLAIREVDLFCRHLDGPVLCQRGANGIDGLISGAAGAASTGGRVTLLLGDVSFLHDVGGLWAARLAGAALTVVVLQNHGGRIFEDLPLGRSGAADAMGHFTTPHDLGLAPAASLYGLDYHRARTAGHLRAALAAAPERERARLVEVELPRVGLEPVRRRIIDRIAGELGVER
ncbi:MAG TPA: thiamine pyrophosphate-dependent enzyme, partial [Solirubrobacteraceae bacterium]|nr:thiamine pyrophosphate-dependent enzyme [Solirubrobacteraceae bacterium]